MFCEHKWRYKHPMSGGVILEGDKYINSMDVICGLCGELGVIKTETPKHIVDEIAREFIDAEVH